MSVNLLTGQSDDPTSLLPLYLQTAHIERVARRERALFNPKRIYNEGFLNGIQTGGYDTSAVLAVDPAGAKVRLFTTMEGADDRLSKRRPNNTYHDFERRKIGEFFGAGSLDKGVRYYNAQYTSNNMAYTGKAEKEARLFRREIVITSTGTAVQPNFAALNPDTLDVRKFRLFRNINRDPSAKVIPNAPPVYY